MKWTISYYDDNLKSDILSMSESILAAYLSTIDLLIEFGPTAPLPNTNRIDKIDKDLYRLCVSSDKKQIDFFCCTAKEGKIVILYRREHFDEMTEEQVGLIKKRQREVTTNGKAHA